MAQLGLLAIMSAMAEDVSPVPVATGVLELARFLNEHHEALSDEQATTLMVLGAGLWRRSIELGDTVPAIDAALAKRH